WMHRKIFGDVVDEAFDSDPAGVFIRVPLDFGQCVGGLRALGAGRTVRGEGRGDQQRDDARAERDEGRVGQLLHSSVNSSVRMRARGTPAAASSCSASSIRGTGPQTYAVLAVKSGQCRARNSCCKGPSR